MKLLLDTHAILWFATNNSQLSTRAKSLIEDGENDRFLSVASLWEIAIKVSAGKLRLDNTLEKFIADVTTVNLTSFLALEVTDFIAVSKLKYHHRDPFDRIIVAQALNRQMVIVSSDTQLDAYGVHRKW